MTRRISRGTPYVLTSGEVEIALKSLTPKTVLAIASLLEMTVADWDALDDRMKVKHLIDYQNSSILAATLAAGAKAHTDLEAAGIIQTREATVDALTAEIDTLREMVRELNEQTPKKGKK